MQTNTNASRYISLLTKSLLLVLSIAVAIHVSLAIITAISRHHIYYINPIRLLGADSLWSKYENSDIATAISWMGLISFYSIFTIFYIRKRDKELIDRYILKLKDTRLYNNKEMKTFFSYKSLPKKKRDNLKQIIARPFYRIKDFLVESEN